MGDFIIYFLIGLVAGLVIGAIIMRIVSRAKQQADLSVQNMLQKNLEDLKVANEEQIAELKQSHETYIAEVRKGYEVQLADLKQSQETQLTDLKQAHEKQLKEVKDGTLVQLEEQKKRFDEIVKTVSEQMKTASDQMLKDRQKEFTEASGKNLGNIVDPLKESIKEMKKAMSDSALKQTELSTELKTNIENLIKHSDSAKKSADELARAFKHGSKVQGDWGETVLTNLLESQGLTRGVHFDIQTALKDKDGKTIRNEEGSIMRPDLVLHLDNRRSVIVDSKVSLKDFMDYVNAETPEEKERALKAHVDSIQKHYKELSAKDYSSYIQPPKQKMDYVIMFVPHSGALWSALNAQPNLWQSAMEQNVYIADEQSLYGALKIINMTWTQIAQVENHQKVFALADEMVDRVGKFVKNFEGIGSALKNAQKAYDEAGKKLEERGHSIIRTSQKLIDLGAKQNDKYPIPELLDVDDIPEIMN